MGLGSVQLVTMVVEVVVGLVVPPICQVLVTVDLVVVGMVLT